MGRNILIISPQEWGIMHVAKHHYARCLAEGGNHVFFLEPPVFGKPWSLEIKPLDLASIQIVTFSCPIPFFLRFKFRKIYDRLIHFYIKKILKKINLKFDIVWSFESNLYSNLRIFLGKKTIYHPVDELLYNYQIKPGQNVDLVLSVTKEILSKYDHLPIQKHHIHHGLGDDFAKIAQRKMETLAFVTCKKPIKVGYIGNLLRPSIDYPILLEIIEKNEDVQFVFWGNYSGISNNLGGDYSEVKIHIEKLSSMHNVELRGAVPPSELSAQIQEADAFLICYDINKDLSNGTNYHKIMEYLSVGKIIISNNVTTFHDHPDFFAMTTSRKNNEELVSIFAEVKNEINKFNSPDLQLKRIKFALSNTYSNHIKQIISLLEGV